MENNKSMFGEQSNMFPELKNDIDREWEGMPEFIMEDKTPIKQLIVSFKNFDDYKEFAKLINQNLTKKTQSVWFPKADIETYSDKKYIDEK